MPNDDTSYYADLNRPTMLDQFDLPHTFTVEKRDGELLLCSDERPADILIDEDSDVSPGDEVTVFEKEGKILTSVKKKRQYDKREIEPGVYEVTGTKGPGDEVSSPLEIAETVGAPLPDSDDPDGQTRAPNHADLNYQDYLWDILSEGHESADRTGTGTIKSFGRQMRFDLTEGFPLLTTKAISFENVARELLWFLDSGRNIRPLLKDGVSIWTPNAYKHHQENAEEDLSESEFEQRIRENPDFALEWGDLGRIYGPEWRDRSGERSFREVVKVRPREKERCEPDFPLRDIQEPKSSRHKCGNKYTSNSGRDFIVIQKSEQPSKKTRYDVQFLETGYLARGVRTDDVNDGGSIKDRYAPTVHGVGFVGEESVGDGIDQKLYQVWQSILERCYNPDHPAYDDYGGAGVFVHPEWHNFTQFKKDARRLPNWTSKRAEPDAYEIDKDYYQSNCYSSDTCVWVRRAENQWYQNEEVVRVGTPEGDSFIALSGTHAAMLTGEPEGTVSKKLAGIGNMESSGHTYDWVSTPPDYNYRLPLPFDQIANLVEQLQENPDSRRLRVDAWKPRVHMKGAPDEDEAALPPCHTDWQVFTRELSIEERHNWAIENGHEIPTIGTIYDDAAHEAYDDYGVPRRALSLKWNQRSVDSFLGLPYNIASYALLTHLLAHQTGMVPETLIFSGGDCHIYRNHVAQVEELLSRTPRTDLPQLKIGREEPPDDIGDYQFEDFSIEGYDAHPKIQAPLAV
jgi:thymidylate synthase